MATGSNVVYADINAFFQQNNLSDILTGDNAIIGTIINLIIISRRSVKFRSSAGSALHQFLQQPATPEGAAAIRGSLLQDLNAQQPAAAIGINDIVLVPDGNRTGYSLSIRYTSRLDGFTSTATFRLAVQNNQK